VPEELARFVPAEWAGEPDPLAAWMRARLDFVEANPDTELGGLVETLAAFRRLRVEMASTAPVRPAQHRHPDIT
jgi:hypothetical protein